MKRTKIWVSGPMVWIGCTRCEKFWSDFVARTFALIAPVQPILHWVSCSNEMIPNPPRHYETHQNMSLGLDGVDRVDLLQKILTRFCGTKFCINCNSFSLFWTEYHKAMERSQVHPNTMKRNKTWVLGPMGWIGCIHCEKFQCDFVARTFAIIAPHSAHFAPSLMQQRNSPKCTQTLRNTRKHEFRIQWVDLARLLRKIPMWLRGTNFCINCTTSARFAPSLLP